MSQVCLWRPWTILRTSSEFLSNECWHPRVQRSSSSTLEYEAHVTLYNDEGLLVGEGTCHSVNSDLVLGATCPLGDTHVAMFVAKSHSEEHLPQEHVYSLVAWPIQYVHCRGASLQDHEARDNFNGI